MCEITCMVKRDDYITSRLSSRLRDSRRRGADVVQQEHARLRRLLQIVVQVRERLRQPSQRGQQPLVAPRRGSHQRARAAYAPVRRGVDGPPVRDAELAGPPEHEVRVRALGHPLRDRLEERREERGGEVAKRGRHRIRRHRLQRLRHEGLVVVGAPQPQRHEQGEPRVAVPQRASRGVWRDVLAEVRGIERGAVVAREHHDALRGGRRPTLAGWRERHVFAPNHRTLLLVQSLRSRRSRAAQGAGAREVSARPAAADGAPPSVAASVPLVVLLRVRRG
mmetsp:Transcript_13079/g.52728  ORF Transcript_13079/g.52728 Transcript_13079/m.52728 type:complete len:279 (-) Transcript_13079:2009-2845(-)